MESFITATEASRLFASLPEVLQVYISQRGGVYDIPPWDVLRKVPDRLHDNPIEIYKFLKAKDISHLEATSAGGDSADFRNWTFENGDVNSARQADPMRIEEYLDAQAANQVDASAIEFGTPDPGSPFYNEAFAEAFDVYSQAEAVNLDEFIETLTGPGVSKNGWGAAFPMDAGDAGRSLWEGLGESLAEVGIPVTYVAMKGFGGVLPFLRSIDSKQFRTNGQYRQSVLARALRVFREHGWKDAAKAVVVGFLIAMFPPISFFIAAVGLTGVAAMGTRWLANKAFKFHGPTAVALGKVADAIQKVHAFLKRALDALERIVEVVIEAATNVTKRVIKAGARFVSSVYQVAKSVARDVAKSAQETVSRVADKVSGWIFSWFTPNFDPTPQLG